MTLARPVLVVAVPALMLGACSLLLDFSHDGQPCDSQQQCLTGHVCTEGICRASDGGTGACGAGCERGMRCREATGTCVPDTCANRICPVGTACVESEGGTTCAPVQAPALGRACSTDEQCDTTQGRATASATPARSR